MAHIHRKYLERCPDRGRTRPGWAWTACFTGTPERAAALAKARQGSGSCGVKCNGCGCRGGPGYRNQKGRCVSYKRLEKECGPPLYTRCTAECFPAPAECDS